MSCGCSKKSETSYYIICSCGTKRIMDYGIKAGDPVKLDPCPKCGDSIEGVFTGDSVEERFNG